MAIEIAKEDISMLKGLLQDEHSMIAELGRGCRYTTKVFIIFTGQATMSEYTKLRGVIHESSRPQSRTQNFCQLNGKNELMQVLRGTW